MAELVDEYLQASLDRRIELARGTVPARSGGPAARHADVAVPEG